MNREAFIEKLFARASEMDFEAYEVYYVAASSFRTQVLRGEILDYRVSDSMSLGFRALKHGRMGYAATQILDDEAIDLLLDGARTNAQLIESDDPQFIYAGDAVYPALSLYSEALAAITPAEKIEMAKQLEQYALNADPRIAQVDSCTILSTDETCAIVNSKGLNRSFRRNLLAGYVEPIAREGDRVNTGFKVFSAAEPAEITLKKTAEAAAEQAVRGLNAARAKSGKTRILLRADAAIDLITTFASIFSADAAQRGLSLLRGREGEMIAAPNLTLIDDPLMEKSASSAPFDGEGIAARTKRLVENGRLNTLLHNLKTAAKQGVQTTGNAARGSSASPVGIAPSNLYIEPGTLSRDALIAQLGDGLLITDLMGLHAGANAVSGDFSLSARGEKIENGKRVCCVDQLTIAGNFFELLLSIEAIGSDLEFSTPSVSRFGSPSLLIPSLSVAGE